MMEVYAVALIILLTGAFFGFCFALFLTGHIRITKRKRRYSDLDIERIVARQGKDLTRCDRVS